MSRRAHPPSLWAVIFSLLACGSLVAQDHSSFSTEKRVLWKTSRVTGTPDPPSPYRTVNAFPNIKLTEPLAMTSAPGSNRFFVAEQAGRIISFENNPAADSADVALDLKGKTLYGLAIHPQFQSNGYVFVTILVADPADEDPRGTRVSRFKLAQRNPPTIDPDSETVIFEWRSGGHNGGCIKFGPDGYLYLATGDSSGIADQLRTGQDLSNVSGAILRIDVDRPGAAQPYSIPPDNPFVDMDNARPEIWAYGLRQPWKFTFDRNTGDLWTGNVGQDLWEQIFVIERGGNYGWSVMEGGHVFRPERKRGPTPFIPPIVEHNHTEFRSITGGFIYHGTRLPELTGAYIYGDYDTGKIWMFRYDRDNGKVTEHRELVDSALRLVGFGEDNSGELLLVDHMGGLINRLEASPAAVHTMDFPRRLSETGLFESVRDHRVSPGVIPYGVNAPQWADGATKQRYLALPGQSKIEFDGITYPQPAPGAPHGWKFPDGTVAMETISMEMQPGNPDSQRRLETRLLHYEQLVGSETVGDQLWRGYTYIWNDQQTDAVLLEDPSGKDVELLINDPVAPGKQRTQTWHFPGRAECTVCHNMAAKYVLGINTLQMNRDFKYGNSPKNQLQIFAKLGLFTDDLPKQPDVLPSLDNYRNSDCDIAMRARSYLHANCSHCHRKWGGGNGEFRLLASLSHDDMGINDERPRHGGFYIPDARMLAPGDPNRSVLFYRMAKLGPGRMPRLGSGVVDQEGLNLIYDWISGLKPSEAGSAAESIAESLNGHTSADARAARIDELLATTTSAIDLMRATGSRFIDPAVRIEVIERAAGSSAAHVRDLFEQFLPEELRPKRLGNVIQPNEILSLAGDADQGKMLYLKAAGVQCRNCHRIHGQGTEIGPDLSGIGTKYKERSRLLDTILNPSREVDPKYRVYLAQTVDGLVATGLLVKKDDRKVVLKDTKGKLTTIAADDIEELVQQQQSMMPELLLRDMTSNQVADLLAYLSSLKQSTKSD
ncbi:MAG: PQQ-dependent sugar dehydrogenase [Fuerstiella sp.]|nr:PQQ-dependent sugar dehydrogenase [Fuerstiella sp.]